MADLHIIVPGDNLPPRLYGSCPGFTIRRLVKSEQITIEDYFHDKLGEEAELAENYTTVAILDVSRELKEIVDYAMVVEFALLMIARNGHPRLLLAVMLDKGHCIDLMRLPRFDADLAIPTYLPRLRKETVSQWVSTCVKAYQKSKDRLHITMYRFIRYGRTLNLADRLMDLAISLESLLESQTEVSFRFCVSLTKATDKRANEAIHYADLLAELYALRSKLAHGDPAATKLIAKLKPRIAELHKLSREILTSYVIFMSAHTRTDWAVDLKRRLFA